MSAFAIPYAFARTHKRLADVATYRSTGLVSGRFQVAGATGSPRDTVVSAGGAGDDEDGALPAYLSEEFGLDSPRCEGLRDVDEDVADEDEDAAAMAGVPSYYAVSHRRMAVAGDPTRIAHLQPGYLHERGIT